MSQRDSKGRFTSGRYELVWWDGYTSYEESEAKKREPVEILLFGTERFVAVRESGAVEELAYNYSSSAGYQRLNRKLVRVSA